MPSNVIGALRVTLGLDAAQFTSGAQSAEKRAEQLGRRIGASMRSAAGEVGTFAKAFAALGTIAGAAALGDLAKRSLEYAASLGETAQQLGVTTKDLQEYRYAASQVGISQETIDKSLAKLTVTMGQARAGVEKPTAAFAALSKLLGQDVLKSAQTAGDAIPLIADALAKVSDPAQRAALEVALFGKTGQQLDTLLAGGSAGVNELTQAAQDLGIVISDDAIQNADKAADKIDELKTVLEASIAGAVASNASAIYDFVSAIERLVGKIPAALNALRDFRDRLSSTAGILQVGIGAATLNPARIQQGLQQFGDAQSRRNLRRAQAQEAVLDARFPNTFLKPKPQPKAAGAGEGIDISGSQARTAAAVSAARNRAAAKAARDQQRDAEKAARDERHYQSELSRAEEDRISATLDITVGDAERAQLERDLLKRDHEARLTAISTDKDLTDARKASLVAIENDTYRLKQQAQDRKELEQAQANALKLAQAQNDNEAEVLRAKDALARTAKERRDIELKLLDLQFTELRRQQQAVLNDPNASKTDKDIAIANLKNIGQLEPLARANVVRQTQGPLASYLDGLPRSADELNEALQGVATNGLQSITDGLAGAIAGTQRLGDVFKNVATQIVADLAKIAIEKAIVGPLAKLLNISLGGTASFDTGAFNSGLSSAVDSVIGHRASGGPVTGGKNYIVGERGPELFSSAASGQIISNDNLPWSGGGVTMHQTLNVQGAVDLATRTEVYKLAAATRASAIQGVKEADRRRG